ncbi:MAG: hypothetical protein EA384_17045 [Spirochaetaceae bacterium]|nr:MAG: hypothetical protein EA384_17045 [Spirochaetaceae bacterium]
MLRATKTVLNAAFLVFAVGGFALIFFSRELLQLVEMEVAFLAPTALVTAYALLVWRLLAHCYEQAFADHHLDSVYFLGFLFTLFSLVTLFRDLHSGLSLQQGDGSAQVAGALYYVGISVSTSIAGVLFRNMARGAWLRDHPEDPDHLQKSYELLKSIADGFSANYRQTFEQIQLFLAERQQGLSVLTEREKEYLAALERFIGATNGFSSALDGSQREMGRRIEELAGALERQATTVAEFSNMTDAFSRSAARVHAQAERLPLEAVNEELQQFQRGVGELNEVLDSFISLLETRVERVG